MDQFYRKSYTWDIFLVLKVFASQRQYNVKNLKSSVLDYCILEVDDQKFVNFKGKSWSCALIFWKESKHKQTIKKFELIAFALAAAINLQHYVMMVMSLRQVKNRNCYSKLLHREKNEGFQ